MANKRKPSDDLLAPGLLEEERRLRDAVKFIQDFIRDHPTASLFFPEFKGMITRICVYDDIWRRFPGHPIVFAVEYRLESNFHFIIAFQRFINLPGEPHERDFRRAAIRLENRVVIESPSPLDFNGPLNGAHHEVLRDLIQTAFAHAKLQDLVDHLGHLASIVMGYLLFTTGHYKFADVHSAQQRDIKLVHI